MDQFDLFADAEKPAEFRGDARARKVQMPSEEEMVRLLLATGRYRIQRRLEPFPVAEFRMPGFDLTGVVVDTETTGLDCRKDEIIEIGLIVFTFNERGELGDVIGTYGGLREPGIAISPEITRITGITEEMVRGQSIDLSEVERLVAPADLVIAHNASFDRPFCERLSDVFITKAWACSVSEIDWTARGYEGSKLGYLVGQAGFFHHGHRAVDDCIALLKILSMDVQGGSGTALGELLRSSRKTRIRIYAEASPFEMKDVLKARGYRWSDGTDGRPKCWWTEVDEADEEAELHFLRTEIYRWNEADPPRKRLDAHERFKA